MYAVLDFVLGFLDDGEGSGAVGGCGCGLRGQLEAQVFGVGGEEAFFDGFGGFKCEDVNAEVV